LVLEVTGKRPKKAQVPKLDQMLGPLEAEVMEIIWLRETALVSEVEEVLNKRRTTPLAYKTVLTICTRLSEKGLLNHQKDGRAFRYYPTMTQPEFVSRQASKASSALLSRFGDVALSSFVDQVAADPEQLAALRNLLGRDEYASPSDAERRR
jgi:predicted transcriptional regulator